MTINNIVYFLIRILYKVQQTYTAAFFIRPAEQLLPCSFFSFLSRARSRYDSCL